MSGEARPRLAPYPQGMTRIACCQMAPVAGNVDLSIQRCSQAIEDAVARGAEVIVLPELATSGYVFESKDEAASAAIQVSHPVFEEWARQVEPIGAVLVAGFCEEGPSGTLFNSAAVIDGSGLRTVYRKTHLWDRERLFFEPGDAAPPVIHLPFGRLGVLICYDMEFPEMPRSLALQQVDLITAPTNWPLVDRPPEERAPEVIIAMAAARVNRVAIACCDRTGMERGQLWTEGTCIINQQGWLSDSVKGAGTAWADVDLLASRDKRLSPRNHALDDRRPELYEPSL